MPLLLLSSMNTWRISTGSDGKVQIFDVIWALLRCCISQKEYPSFLGYSSSSSLLEFCLGMSRNREI